MNEINLNKVEQLMQQAEQALASSQTILQELHDNPTMIDIEILQLILQYRMDTQDALIKLLQLDAGLLHLLGLSSQHSPLINLERMAYALGNDDLRHVLYSLSQLVGSLSRIANRYRQHSKTNAKQRQEENLLHSSTPYKKLEQRFQKALAQQHLFITSMSTLQQEMGLGGKLDATKPVLDRIAALRKFTFEYIKALEHRMVMSHQLYKKFSNDIQLDDTLDILLKQAHVVLKKMPLLNETSPFFTPAKMDTGPRLEERAAAKRLGNFFNH